MNQSPKEIVNAKQRDIFDEQLRIHVKFATEHFLQVFEHPREDLRQQAPQYKSFLTELETITSNKSIYIDNLQPALNLINKCEKDLMKKTNESQESKKPDADEYNKTNLLPKSST